MKKSEWLDCQRNEFFPKQKGIPSLVKIEHKNTATLDSARSKKKSKVAVLQLDLHGERDKQCAVIILHDQCFSVFILCLCLFWIYTRIIMCNTVGWFIYLAVISCMYF